MHPVGPKNLFIFTSKIVWHWTAFSTYVSPVISIISACLYFGLWQVSAYLVTIATVIGGGTGVLIGLAYQTPQLQIVLFFFAIWWLNKIPGWGRGPIVLSMLSLILGTIWPVLSNGAISPLQSFRSILALLLVPYLITGVSILLPKPGLAIYAARSQVVIVCRKVALMSFAVVNAFKSYDYLDLHCAEFDQWLTEVRADLTSLRQLQAYADYERLVFWNMVDFPAALGSFIDVSELMVQELVGIQDMVKAIAYNHTQIKFVEELAPILVEIAEEIEIALTIIGEYMESFHPFTTALYEWEQWVFGCFRTSCTRHQPQLQSQRSKMKSFYEVPRSEALIEMHLAHSDNKSGLSRRDGVSPRRERSLTDLYGFHQYQVTRDIEEGKLVVDDEGAKDNQADSDHARRVSFAQSPTAHSPTRDQADSHSGCDQPSTSDFRGTPEEKLENCTARLATWRSRLLFAFNEVRRNFIFGTLEEEVEERDLPSSSETQEASTQEQESKRVSVRPPSVDQPSLSAAVHRPDVLQALHHTYTLEQRLADEVIAQGQSDIHHASPLFAGPGSPSSMQSAVESADDDHELKDDKDATNRRRFFILAFREENLRLSLRNLGPRAAYIHRLSVLIEYVASLPMVLSARGKPFSIATWLQQSARFIGAYLFSWWTFLVQSIEFWCTGLFAVMTGQRTMRVWRAQISKDAQIFIEDNSQPIKIATGITISLALIVYDYFSTFFQGGLWLVLVLALIRQDNTSPSFLMGYQRLEGTIVGSIYAVLVFTIFDCGAQRCSDRLNIPAIVLWVAFCSYFREGPQHGYAAIVASFTPIVLLLGTETTLAAAWGRIEETFLGILIYLVIDNAVYPKRAFPAIKQLILKGVDETRVMFSHAVQAVQELVMVHELPALRSQSSRSVRRGDPALIPEARRTRSESIPPQQGLGLYGSSTNVRLRSQSTAEVSEVEARTQPFAVVDHVRAESSDRHLLPDRDKQSRDDDEDTEDQNDDPDVRALFERCCEHLDIAEQQLKDMKGHLIALSTLLDAAVYEPMLFQRLFPLPAYQQLHQTFLKVYRSAVALNSGSRAFGIILKQMLRRHEHVEQFLAQLSYMAKYMFNVAAKADVALKSALDALSMMYEQQNFDAELTSLLTLRRVCDRLIQHVDEYFRTRFLRQSVDVLTQINPYFIVAWQNVFEGVSDMIRDLSELGMALLIVRNAEARSYS